MRGFIEVTLKDEDGTKQLLNLQHVRAVRVQGRGDRASTMLEMAGDSQRWLVCESYAEVKASIGNAAAQAGAAPQVVRR